MHVRWGVRCRGVRWGVRGVCGSGVRVYTCSVHYSGFSKDLVTTPRIWSY